MYWELEGGKGREYCCNYTLKKKKVLTLDSLFYPFLLLLLMFLMSCLRNYLLIQGHNLFYANSFIVSSIYTYIGSKSVLYGVKL